MDRRYGKNQGISPVWVLLLVYWASLVPLWSQAAPEIDFERGVAAYSQQQYANSAAIFSDLAKSHPSPAVFYNLGNALYRNGKKGEALAAYHAALRLDPSHQDALFNLQFLGGQSSAQLFYYQWVGWFSTYTWAILTLFFLALISVAVLLLYRRPSVWLAKIMLVGMILSAILALFSFGASFLRRNWESQVLGVVVIPAAELKAEPIDASQTLVRAQEGATGKILSESGDWYYLRLDGMEPGWVPKSAVRNTAAWK